jgi:RNA polymerase sigma factor (sigma-70 family)
MQRVDTAVDTDERTATSPGPTGQRIDLHRALDTLSRRQREVIVLRFLADLPEAEVARALGCSVGSVKQHASRGLAALRNVMAVDLDAEPRDARPRTQEND